ncbi:hypothetical protein G5B10_13520 [Fluviicola sp. SGL-29]|nr:hypothetical protein [Fluviicola sp. SGL-29]
MSPSGKSVTVIVLSYVLFGLFNLFQFGTFVLPVTYTELVIFILVTTVFVQHLKYLNRAHLSLFTFSLTGLIIHPFLWEIFLNQQQQYQLYDSIVFDVLSIVKWMLLALFFLLLSYDREKHMLKIEWLVPSLISLGCLLNPPMWYFPFLFIVSGFSAFYTLRRRTVGGDFTMDVLIGIGVIYFLNLFFLV